MKHSMHDWHDPTHDLTDRLRFARCTAASAGHSVRGAAGRVDTGRDHRAFISGGENIQARLRHIDVLWREVRPAIHPSL
jgi:hypothetical protein